MITQHTLPDKDLKFDTHGRLIWLTPSHLLISAPVAGFSGIFHSFTDQKKSFASAKSGFTLSK